MDDKLVTLARYKALYEAQFAKDVLLENGIKAIVVGGNLAGVPNIVLGATKRVIEVKVFAADIEKAATILEEQNIQSPENQMITEDKLVTAEKYWTIFEAQFDRDVLIENGIDAVVVGDMVKDILPTDGMLMAELKVRMTQLEKAREILDVHRAEQNNQEDE